MFKKILISAGKLFSEKLFGGIMSLILGLFGLIISLTSETAKKTFFSGIANYYDLIILLSTIILIIVISFLILQFGGYGLIQWGKSIPHNVKVRPIPSLKSDFKDIGVVRFFAALKIINNEDLPIENCYAVLKKAVRAGIAENPTGINSNVIGLPKLRWDNGRDDEVFETYIGAYKGESVLLIYENSVNTISKELLLSDFCIEKKETQRIINLPLSKIFNIEIDFFGKVGEEVLKINSFSSYINVNPDDGSVGFSTKEKYLTYQNYLP